VDREWQMANGKLENPVVFAIYYLPFTMQAGVFSAAC
jgi:hypothetical protein